MIPVSGLPYHCWNDGYELAAPKQVTDTYRREVEYQILQAQSQVRQVQRQQ